jgi:hypothetical protein
MKQSECAMYMEQNKITPRVGSGHRLKLEGKLSGSGNERINALMDKGDLLRIESGPLLGTMFMRSVIMTHLEN